MEEFTKKYDIKIFSIETELLLCVPKKAIYYICDNLSRAALTHIKQYRLYSLSAAACMAAHTLGVMHYAFRESAQRRYYIII